MGKEVTCWAKRIWERRLEGRRAHPRQDGSARGPGWGCIDYKQPPTGRQSLPRDERKPIRFAAMSANRPVDSVRPLGTSDLDAAAALLADRHRRHRQAEPLLDPAYEDPAACRPEIEALLGADMGGGWVALRDGAVVGYLIGLAKTEAVWGANVWVEAAGHAAEDPAIVRKLYAV